MNANQMHLLVKLLNLAHTAGMERIAELQRQLVLHEAFGKDAVTYPRIHTLRFIRTAKDPVATIQEELAQVIEIVDLIENYKDSQDAADAIAMVEDIFRGKK